MDLETFNALPADNAEAELLKCCGCTDWAKQVAGRRPFANSDQLIRVSDEVWSSLSAQDWLEAFKSHPKIGEKKAAAATSAQSQKWSEDEQSGARDESVATTLAELNQKYERKVRAHLHCLRHR